MCHAILGHEIMTNHLISFTFFSRLHYNLLHPFCHLQGVGTDPYFAFTLPHDAKQMKEKAEHASLQQLDEEMSIRIGRAGTLSGKPPFMYPHQPLQSVLLFNDKHLYQVESWNQRHSELQPSHSDIVYWSLNLFWVQLLLFLSTLCIKKGLPWLLNLISTSSHGFFLLTSCIIFSSVSQTGSFLGAATVWNYFSVFLTFESLIFPLAVARITNLYIWSELQGNRMLQITFRKETRLIFSTYE